MTSADQYRVKALAFADMASCAANPRLQLEYAGMAELYFRLAVLAGKYQKTDIVYETPTPAGPSADTA
jgi:hypothetical protein